MCVEGVCVSVYMLRLLAVPRNVVLIFFYGFNGMAGTPANVDAMVMPNAIKLNVPTMLTTKTHRPMAMPRDTLSFCWTDCINRSKDGATATDAANRKGRTILLNTKKAE